MKAPKIIAEIGCNHKGDMTIAREMIMTAAIQYQLFFRQGLFQGHRSLGHVK